MGEPARGYKWQQFQPGHELSKVHGAQSQRSLAPIADALGEELAAVAPWCSRPAFAPSVRAWAMAEAVCELYRRWFAERGLFDDKGQPLPGLDRWDRAEARAAKARERLGLDPSSFARLLAQVDGQPAAAEERERLLAEARQLIEARAS